MDIETLTVIVSGASGVFVLDRVLALVKALRARSVRDVPDCSIALETIKTMLQRVIDTQNSQAEAIRQICSGQGVLLDRRRNSLSPRTVELVQTYAARRRERRDMPSSDPPPMSESDRRRSRERE